jgi:hypothetical protein
MAGLFVAGVCSPGRTARSDLAAICARVVRTVAFLQSVPIERFEGGEKRPVELKFANFAKTFRGDGFGLGFLLPNFLFHVATAHAILRHNGLKIGKADYMMGFHRICRIGPRRDCPS